MALFWMKSGLLPWRRGRRCFLMLPLFALFAFNTSTLSTQEVVLVRLVASTSPDFKSKLEAHVTKDTFVVVGSTSLNFRCLQCTKPPQRNRTLLCCCLLSTMKLQALFLAGSISLSTAFAPPTFKQPCQSSIFLSAEPTATDDEATAVADSINSSLTIPLTYQEMISQTSTAMNDAYIKGYTRQIVRILLPRDAKSGQIGEYYEGEAQTERGKSAEMKLVPTDESWQGGIMQVCGFVICNVSIERVIAFIDCFLQISCIELHLQQQKIS